MNGVGPEAVPEWPLRARDRVALAVLPAVVDAHQRWRLAKSIDRFDKKHVVRRSFEIADEFIKQMEEA